MGEADRAAKAVGDDNATAAAAQLSVRRCQRGWRRLAILRAWAWAAPVTLVGLWAVLAAGPRLARGQASLRRVDRTLELAWHRGALPDGSWLARSPYSALTLGHLVLGTCADELERLRVHEAEHVRQFERWGALLLLAYPLASLWAGLCGRCAYRDNCFERAALAAEAAARGHI